MAVYTVYLPPDGNAEEARFVSDRHSLLALAFPGFWLLFNRLWYAFALYLLLGAAIAVIAWAAGNLPASLLSMLPGLFLFLHGGELRAGRLERLGWRETALVSADDREEAELLFFGAPRSGKEAPKTAFAAGWRPAPAIPRPLGIFPE